MDQLKLTPPGAAPKIALLFQGTGHEADLPTQRHQAEAHSWFPGSHGDPRRSQGDQRQARQRAQAPLGVVPPAPAGRILCVFPAPAVCVAGRTSTGFSRRRSCASARARSALWRALTLARLQGLGWLLRNGSPTAQSIATESSVASGSHFVRIAIRFRRATLLCN